MSALCWQQTLKTHVHINSLYIMTAENKNEHFSGQRKSIC